MGNYATTTTLETVMIGTVFDSLTTALAERCIFWAENEVNKYISKRYDIGSFLDTYSAVPPIIRSLTERLSEGYTYRQMARGSRDMLERAQEIIDPVMENLKGISDGDFDLLNTSGSVISEMSNSSFRVLSNTNSYYNTFDEDDPLNWKVDSDKLTDIANDRK